MSLPVSYFEYKNFTFNEKTFVKYWTTIEEMLFNTYICSPLIFDIPIKTLNELKIKYLYPDSTMPDFRNLNHSMTLKIIERVSTPKRTGLNSMKMNYIDSLKEFAFNLIT